MIPQLEALAMLNNMFESFDGRPVENAILTRKDYGFLIQVLTARTEAPAAPSSSAAPLPPRLSPEPADLVELAQWWIERPNDFGPDHISMRCLKMLCGEVIRLSAPSARATPTEDYKALYMELIYEVANKWPNESRHETAKRYIYEREHRPSSGPHQASGAVDVSAAGRKG